MEEYQPDKPLLHMLQKLINEDDTSNKNTEITNKQFEQILKLEYNIPVEECSDAEVNIYRAALKAFLKSWPQWQEFDKKYGEDKPDSKFVFAQYLDLKSYLLQVLNEAKKELAHLVEEGKVKLHAPKTDRVVMEAICSRQRLKYLFYHKPSPQNLTIFNLGELPPQVTNSTEENSFSIAHILNWFDVKMTLKTAQLRLIRKITGNNNLKLCNKKITHTLETVQPLPNKVYSKANNAKEKKLRVNDILGYLSEFEAYFLSSKHRTEENQLIIDEVTRDLNTCKDAVILEGAEYQFHLSPYSYTRSMPGQTDIPSNNTAPNLSLCEGIDPDKFDLELRETIKPSCTFTVEVFNGCKSNSFSIFNVSLECLQCGNSWAALENAQEHFSEQHRDEMTPNWDCCKCKGEASSESLAEARWHHVCLEEDSDEC